MAFQALIEACAVILLFAVLYLLVGKPIIKYFEQKESKDKNNEEVSNDPEIVRQKLEELQKRKEELSALNQEVNVTEELEKVKARIAELRARLAQLATPSSSVEEDGK